MPKPKLPRQPKPAHKPDKCKGHACCFHSPSSHHMVNWPMVIRYDRYGLVERICEHGVGHPDPDSLAYIDKCLEAAGWEKDDGIHGCDGDCTLSVYMNNLKSKYITNRTQIKEIIRSIREATNCNRCGAQPIEWHHESHVGNAHRRVSSLVQRSCLKTVIEEIQRCEPLCRSCHMQEDGRIRELLKKAPNRRGSSFPPKPCNLCGKLAKPLRRGLCYYCYERHRKDGRNYGGHLYADNCCLDYRPISLCSTCICMTYTIKGLCGKCKASKNEG